VNAYQERQLDAIGDGTRRAILARLLTGPKAVGDLAKDLPVTRPAVSQHLRVLKEAALVSDRADGTRRVYALNPHAFASLRDYFDHFWTQALDAFKRRVEAPDQPAAARRPRRRKEHHRG
jgi:DNA-binding transcriptional ArsR family regulator